MKKIYFASPLGFTESTMRFMNDLDYKLRLVGFEVLNPWNNAFGKEILETHNIEDYSTKIETLHEINLRIGKASEDLIRECGVVFAVLDGTGVDSGTASEIGFAYGIGKKIFGYRGDFRLSCDNEGSVVNLQVQCWIEKSGGFIIKSANNIEEIEA